MKLAFNKTFVSAIVVQLFVFIGIIYMQLKFDQIYDHGKYINRYMYEYTQNLNEIDVQPIAYTNEFVTIRNMARPFLVLWFMILIPLYLYRIKVAGFLYFLLNAINLVHLSGGLLKFGGLQKKIEQLSIENSINASHYPKSLNVPNLLEHQSYLFESNFTIIRWWTYGIICLIVLHVLVIFLPTSLKPNFLKDWT